MCTSLKQRYPQRNYRTVCMLSYQTRNDKFIRITHKFGPHSRGVRRRDFFSSLGLTRISEPSFYNTRAESVRAMEIGIDKPKTQTIAQWTMVVCVCPGDTSRDESVSVYFALDTANFYGQILIPSWSSQCSVPSVLWSIDPSFNRPFRRE